MFLKYFWDIKEDQNYSPWLLFHAQNVLELFSDNLEIEH
jgi:hypothetical protein